MATQQSSAKYDFQTDSYVIKKKDFMASFYGWGSPVSRLQSYFEEAVYFLPLSFRIFWYSFNWLWKDERLSQPWSHPVILNLLKHYNITVSCNTTDVSPLCHTLCHTCKYFFGCLNCDISPIFFAQQVISLVGSDLRFLI